jgi:hypothetical protein
MDRIEDMAHLCAKIDGMAENEAILKRQLQESEGRNDRLKSKMKQLEHQDQERMAKVNKVLEAATKEREVFQTEKKEIETREAQRDRIQGVGPNPRALSSGARDGNDKPKPYTEPRTPRGLTRLEIFCKEILNLSNADSVVAMHCLMKRFRAVVEDLESCERHR